MMVLMIAHRRLLTVALFMLIFFSNCVISQRSSSSDSGTSEPRQQQQQQPKLVQSNAATATATAAEEADGTIKSQQQNDELVKQVLASTATTAIPKATKAAVAIATADNGTAHSSSSSTADAAATTLLSTATISSPSSAAAASNGESSGDENSAELLAESEDVIERANNAPTTYRPQRPPAIAPHTSAQERERKLMNVLAARRSALHRGGFRTRVGTTGRTAVATSIETTSRTPTDPRSICIRNCTKNFTRRTTASCMRHCANFTRTPTSSNAHANANATSAAVLVRPSSKTGTRSQSGDRDTNEILFTDESSHGLFVVAKDQNDTHNHISDLAKGNGSAKLRSRGKPTSPTTAASTSIEDDDVQPYLYFGQKLPPIKPAFLTITSVSNEHPKLLEVSVAQLASTTPAPKLETSTLSAVERSRSRYKYNMRGGVSFNKRLSTTGKPLGLLGDHVAEVRAAALSSGPSTTERAKEESTLMRHVQQVTERLPATAEKVIEPSAASKLDAARAALGLDSIDTSTPLLITVLGEEEDSTMSHSSTTTTARSQPKLISTTTTSTTTTTTTTTRAPPTTTTSTTTTPLPTSMSTSTTTTAAPTTLRPVTTTARETTTRSSSSTTTTTSAPDTTTKRKNIVEEDTERLRALGPMLTQEISIDEKPNLIIFYNRTSGVLAPPTTRTTRRPPAVPDSHTTDASATILRTTILSSVRSTVNPITSTPRPPQSGTAHSGPTIVGVVETTPQRPVPTGNGISQTAVADEQDISSEMRRMNIATMVLAGIGVLPLAAILLYLVRNYVLRRNAKDDEAFDVCITDQQPISPVKKLDGKFANDEHSDEVDHHMPHLHQTLGKLPSRESKHSHSCYDEQCSVSSEREFERSNIRLKSLLGEGNFGQVWKAEADDLCGHFGATRIVAVKTIRAGSAQAGLKDEVNIMRKLGSHQNVVTLLGACVESEPHMLIMEYAMRGRLLSLLRAARSATSILPASVPGGRSLAPLSPRTLAGFALDLACGMEYIADRRIVHRDLAARNVLLDHNGVCKICDFGMSIDLDAERKKRDQEKNCANDIMRSNSNKFKFDFGAGFIINQWSHNFGNHCQQNSPKELSEKKGHAHGHGHGHDTINRRPALPVRWMAPEALQYHVFTAETDVWAFGIVLWEIATLGCTPYSHLTGREVIRRVPNGLRPDLPKEGRHEFYNLMARCWHKDPQMRPSFTQARVEVSRSLHKWVDDDSAASDYMDVSGFSEDLEHGMVYFNHRISEFECEI